MEVRDRLDAVVERWSLLRHPFYQAWSAGTLPAEALATYAREYGAFVATLPLGWRTLGDEETAREEQEHAELWDGFARELGTAVGEPALAGVADLVEEAHRCFGEPAAAVGALYAFEAQQPATASSKLEGLRRHYTLSPAAERYFELHAANAHEARALCERAQALPAPDQDRAVAACERVGAALWGALSAIHPCSTATAT